jgi:4-cresol dehydrogenase (hydroxylating) flavoprotein subunit
MLTPTFLDTLKASLDPDQITIDDAALNRLSSNTFDLERRPLLVVHPSDSRQVSRICAAASRDMISLHVISAGKNWGYGAAVPTDENCVVIDLSRMRKIVDFDESQATIRLQAGVTFGEVDAFLNERAPRLMLSSTGAPPTTSVVGNTVERGVGAGPYSRRWLHTCDLEVVLASGEIMRTGFARFGGNGGFFRDGLGPTLDGLFIQSNLGIVTEMTFLLATRQPYFTVVQFGAQAVQGIAPLVDALRRLRAAQALSSPATVWNDYRALSVRQQYPWSDSAGAIPLTRDKLESIRANLGFGAWNGALSVSSPTAAISRATEEFFLSVLRQSADTICLHRFVNGRPEGTSSIKGSDQSISAFGTAEVLAEVMQGHAQFASLRSCYWRKQIPIPEEPRAIDILRDRCGVIWVSPVVPLTPHDVAKAAAIAEDVCIANGLEPMVSMINAHEGVVLFVIMLVFDRDDRTQDLLAMRCSQTLQDRFRSASYFPYRLGIQMMSDMPQSTDDYDAVLTRIKAALDPSGILAPSRYSVRRTSA